MTQENKIICPYCFLPVAPRDPEKIITANGWAHYGCVLQKINNKCLEVGLPKPLCRPWQLEDFLANRLKELLQTPINSFVEKKLSVIMKIAEELGYNLKISKLVQNKVALL